MSRLSLSEAREDSASRHVLGLSGGKDSAALAVYLKDKYPEIHEKIEYFFTDTGAELREVYDFLDVLEAYLGKEIIRLSSGRPFEHWLRVHNDFLPSPRQRWCTRVMKIKPFEQFVGDDPVISYIGIRADEYREGYLSSKETIKAAFPFIEDGLQKRDIFQILEDSVGIPKYYEWRSRSGCYFCFFQRQDEWLGLSRNHPDLFQEAVKLEEKAGNGYTWVTGMSLRQVVAHAASKESHGVEPTAKQTTARWQERLADEEDDDSEDRACIICSL